MKIVLISKEYATEHFYYETEQKAEKGFDRLKLTIAKRFVQDGIDRTIYLVKDEFRTTETMNDEKEENKNEGGNE